MSDPARFSDDDGDEHERRLLRSAAGDRGSDRALRATLGAMGAAAGVALGAASASAGVAAATSAGGAAAGSAGGGLTAATGSAGLAAWVGLGALLGAITVGGVAAVEGASRPVASAALIVVEPRPAPITGDAPASAPQALNDRPAPTPPRASAGTRTAIASLAADVPPGAPADRADFPPAPPNAPPTATDSLAAEVGALQRVRVALAAGDAPGALAALNAHARDFVRPALGPEAAVLRVEALARVGRRAEASALADRLLAASPSSPHATRLRTVLGRGSNP